MVFSINTVNQEQVLSVMVDNFADSMKQKLIKKSREGLNDWPSCPTVYLDNGLKNEVIKGSDYVDVANYALLLTARQYDNNIGQAISYPAKFDMDSDGMGFTVTFRDIPEAVTQGDNWSEALDMAKDALQTAMEFYQEDKRTIPPASKPQHGEVIITIEIASKF